MKTHNANIYHCISCGRIVHAELEATLPQCCGHTMINACTQMIGEGDVGKGDTGNHSKSAAPYNERRKKAK